MLGFTSKQASSQAGGALSHQDSMSAMFSENTSGLGAVACHTVGCCQVTEVCQGAQLRGLHLETAGENRRSYQ